MTTVPVLGQSRRPAPDAKLGGRSRFWTLAIAAALTLVTADRFAWLLAPPPRLREVEDAVADLRRGDPTVLAIGSSHGRTFAVMDDSLRHRTDGRERILAVAVEWGKLSSYRWVLEHRLMPLFDERDAAGSRRRTALRRAIIVTEWWDSCALGEFPINLPARAWAWRDFVTDVRVHGFTEYNGNFLAYRWSRFWRASALVQDRGHGRLLSAFRQHIAPASPETDKALFAEHAEMWQQMVENGAACLGSRAEMGALDQMLDTLLGHGLEVTVVLYPRMPVTLTAQAKGTTLPSFATRVRAAVEPRGVRVVDLTTGAPLTDDDFADDFDHVLPAGNARFAGWALSGPLAFLTRPLK